MTIKIGINGMGRIGRMLVRSIIENQKKNFKISHINNRSNAEVTYKLIKYDSIHGKFNADLRLDENELIINKNKITFSQESKIENIDWKKYDVDYVFECTGKFNSKEKLLIHIKNGAKKVIVSAPCKNADKTIVFGVNENLYDPSKHNIVTAASCTTNCLAPIVSVIHKNFEILKGQITTIHNPTNTNVLLDKPHKDFRRARSTMLSMHPTSTGSAKAIGLIFPELKGKLDGHAVRVPVINSSLTDCVFQLNKKTTINEVNELFEQASKSDLKGILGIEFKPLVSIDFLNDTRSSIVDADSTLITDNNLLKVYSWYDNETGYACRMIDLAEMVCKSLNV